MHNFGFIKIECLYKLLMVRVNREGWKWHLTVHDIKSKLIPSAYKSTAFCRVSSNLRILEMCSVNEVEIRIFSVLFREN